LEYGKDGWHDGELGLYTVSLGPCWGVQKFVSPFVVADNGFFFEVVRSLKDIISESKI
jgi:hypothetical protein